MKTLRSKAVVQYYNEKDVIEMVDDIIKYIEQWSQIEPELVVNQIKKISGFYK